MANKELYLGADVTVRRGSKDRPEFETISGNRMVSEADLTGNEVKELRRQGVVRVPNEADRTALEAAERARERAEAAEEAGEGKSVSELEGMTKAELAAYAAANGIEVSADDTKAELVKAIRQAERER